MKYVKNVNGSGGFCAPSGYRSCLDYWKGQAGQFPTYCSETCCQNKDKVAITSKKEFRRE